MEDTKTVQRLLQRGGFMATIDLKDAYYAVRIHKDSRRFLRFSFGNKLYEFRYLPFGLSLSPWIFTKLLKPVVREL